MLFLACIDSRREIIMSEIWSHNEDTYDMIDDTVVRHVLLLKIDEDYINIDTYINNDESIVVLDRCFSRP